VPFQNIVTLNLNHEINPLQMERILGEWCQRNWRYGNFCVKHKHANVDGP